MFELRGYVDEAGKKRFAKWFKGLDAIAAAKVTMALARIERGAWWWVGSNNFPEKQIPRFARDDG